MQNEGVSKNQSLKKALQILELLADLDSPAKLQDIARKASMPASTVLRFLKTFMDYGYVQQDTDTSFYQLTLKLASIGDRSKRNFPIQKTLSKYVHRIVTTFDESASANIESGMYMMYIITEEGSSRLLTTLSRIGRLAPMHATGGGKLHLADFTEDKLLSYCKNPGLTRFTEYTITDYSMLVRELETIRQMGYAMDNEECELGICCISVPVKDGSGKTLASINISGPTARIKANTDIIPFMMQLSREASAEMGYFKPQDRTTFL